MEDFSSFSPKKIAVFDDFSKWKVRNVLQNLEKSSNMANIAGKWRKFCNFYKIFKWPHLEPKMFTVLYNNPNNILYLSIGIFENT